MQGGVPPSPVAGLISVLEADFRQLSYDARKSEGFASFFSSGDSQPEVKEAAERAVMKIRSLADQPNALDQIRNSKELLKPLQLSCNTNSARLISLSLATVQKMVSNEALSAEGAESVVSMLAKVEKVNDEGVQLKVLQTALTLLQSPLHPRTEDGISTVLGLCFRSLIQKGRRDTVASTAAATVRQSVAIVFTYVDVAAELARLDRLEQNQQQPNAKTIVNASHESIPGINPPEQDLPSQELTAAQKLLEDLIAIATGAPPAWLNTPSLPRTFILEVLDFALVNSSELFNSLPEFQTALSLRISQLLQAQLQDYLDAGAAGAQMSASSFPAFKATLRCVRTLLVRYHTQLGTRCGTLIQTMLRGLGAEHPTTQRIAVAQLVKQLLEDAPLVYYLFVTYDMQKERKLDAVYALVRGAADVVDAALKNSNSSSGAQEGKGSNAAADEDGADQIGALFQSRSSSNKEWTLDTDYETASSSAQQAYLAMLAMDALLHFMASVEVLTYAATEGGGELRGAEWYALSPRERLVLNSSGTTPKEFSGPLPLPIETSACAALVERTWRATLAVLNQMLARSGREPMVLSLLKGFQGFTQACGILELSEPRDAFLGALCQLALAADGDIGPSNPREHGGGAGDGISSPRQGKEGGMGSPGAHQRSLSGDQVDSGIVLTPKNIQAMRTLFNIAHRLANVLGAGWGLVLETLNTLDRVLNSPKTTTQESGPGTVLTSSGSMNNSGQNLLSSDLAILAAAASQLFECTRDMSREAVVALLSGLRDVSLAHLPHMAQVTQPKMFALNRMVEVLLFNVHRIYDLWGIFLSHVLEIVDDPKPPVRFAAIEALGKAIVGALSNLNDSSSSTKQGEGAERKKTQQSPGGSSGVGAESTGGLEHMLLVALEALYNDERDRDVRIGVLRVLLAVLQRHGERLTDGWTPVFRLLSAVPRQNDIDAINLGFQSLQLATTDYMAAMPFSRLKRCLEVAVTYGQQQQDLNVSLTTISLLWNVGDMLSRSGGESTNVAVEKEEEEEFEEEEEKKRGQLSAVTTAAQAEELLELIFSALQALSQDPRPEVRNSGARTLFAVVVTQGPRLSRILWERCLWEMLFPLLRHAFHMSITSSKEEAEAALLGRSRGTQVRLVMHHSRNTEQKQWDETVVVAVGGMARLLRAHLPAIAAMEGMEAGWDELMVVAESSLAGGRKEVAVAAVGLLGGVLGAHGGDDTVVSPEMWKRAMRALDVGVEAATSAGCLVPLSARTELVNLVGALYSTLRPRFSENDTVAVFRWIEAFCRNPWSEDDASNVVQTVGMPPVQKAALALLPTLAPDHLPELWPRYVLSIVRLIQPAHVVAAWQEQEELAAAEEEAAYHHSGGGSGGGNDVMASHATPVRAGPPSSVMGGATPGPIGTGVVNGVQLPPKQAQYRYALNSAFLEKVINVLVQVYGAAPVWVRALAFADIVEALGKCMELRFTVYQEKLWRSAATVFTQLIPIGMAAVNTPLPPAITAADQDTIASVSRAWTSLAVVLENFLLGERFQREQLGVEAPKAVKVAHHRRHPSSLPGDHSSSELPVVPILDVPAAPGKGAATTAQTTKAGRAKRTATAPQPSTTTATTTETTTQQQNQLDPAQSRADADLELSVLDSLTDGILTECTSAPLALKRRLISIVDRGIARPRELSIPQTATGSNFSHVCVRKMYVLCSRPTSTHPDDPLLLVARLALPLFLTRCDAMLRNFAEEARPGVLGDGGPPVTRPRLDEIMCVLEVIASMALAPAVVDAVLAPDEPMTSVVGTLRARPEVSVRGRERTHLLLLYSALCGCVTCKEPRVREMVRDVLGLAGAEIGLGMGQLLVP